MKHTTETKKIFSLQKIKEKNPMWKGGLPRCVDCKIELHSYRAKRCNHCNGKLRGGINSRLWSGGRPNCIDCGKIINRFCTRCRKCLDKFKVREKHHMWKGGITPEHNIIRSSKEYREWRNACFKRDKYTCAKTKVVGGSIVVHHIVNFSTNKDLRFNVNNGITLSETSHKLFHKIYGVKNNNREQLIEFLQNHEK